MNILNKEKISQKYPNRLEKLFGHYKVTLLEEGLPRTKQIDGIKIGYNDLSPMIFASNHPITPVSLLLDKKQDINQIDSNNNDLLYDDTILPQELLLYLRSIPEVTISPHIIPYYDQYVLTLG
ncbi:uncharacterized protein ELE39_000809 [Cryptosporidium sp. chipmunk genotype I]|uniref:uncharacterized protein n=1 Tax=Cryptosporidium sp. chipmunk genotype I TaxID=1280935 RepID=UPI00351A82E3|nr:hypothetical protein ELE39_000809 [Cryptosporidium sp. chipmunk genotype I]